MLNEEGEIPMEEGDLVEFKYFSGGLSDKGLAQTLSAFANGDGGKIYLGVTDRRQIHGVAVTPALLDRIQNTAREGCSPPVPIHLKTIRINPGKSVIEISVGKSGHLHTTASGQSYVRVGSQDKRVLGDELLRLAETKSQVSFEERILEAGIEAIDLSALNEYAQARRTVASPRGDLSPEKLLMKIGLAKEDGATTRIRAGAFILFGKEGESLLLQREFTFVRYEVEGKMYSYREDLSLPAARLLDRLMELIRPYNRMTEGVKGLKRQERYLYPEEAIREALLNAFAHRDYRITGLKNECRLYPDRIEIISPGELPGIVTLENMERRHYSRNPKIMHALLTMGLVEELGQGIHLMRHSLKRNGNRPPEFSESQDQFKVLFRRPKGTVSSLDAQEVQKILNDYCAANETVSRRQIEALCGVRSTAAKYLIQRLLREGRLKVVGRGPGTRYRV